LDFAANGVYFVTSVQLFAMKVFVLLVVLGAALSNPVADVSKDEERAYLEDNLLNNPKIKDLVDKAIQKKKDEAAEEEAAEKAAESEIALDAEEQDAAKRMAKKLMDNPKVHDVVEHMFKEKDEAKKEKEINNFKRSLQKAIDDQKEAEAKDEKADEEADVEAEAEKVEADAKAEENAEETEKLTPELKDQAKAFARKMMDNPKMHSVITKLFEDIKKDPATREARLASLKDSIKHTLKTMKKKRRCGKTSEC